MDFSESTMWNSKSHISFNLSAFVCENAQLATNQSHQLGHIAELLLSNLNTIYIV